MDAVSSSANHFLASLSPEDRALISPHLRPMELGAGFILYAAREHIDRVYFPYAGLVSLTVGLRNGQFLEVCLLGRNSVIGGSAALDVSAAAVQAIGQVAGSGVATAASTLKKLVGRSETLRAAFVRHEHVASAQAQQIGACNAVHGLEARLCRWLLQAHDLLRSDDLPLTQEQLSQVLGVQRTSVTITAQHLQDRGLIDYHRGHIHVLNVVGLRGSACECYDAINDHFLRFTGWSAHSHESQRYSPSGSLALVGGARAHAARP